MQTQDHANHGCAHVQRSFFWICFRAALRRLSEKILRSWLKLLFMSWGRSGVPIGFAPNHAGGSRAQNELLCDRLAHGLWSCFWQAGMRLAVPVWVVAGNTARAVYLLSGAFSRLRQVARKMAAAARFPLYQIFTAGRVCHCAAVAGSGRFWIWSAMVL